MDFKSFLILYDEDISMFYIDNPRQNLVTQDELPQIDIKDREAFAKDIKEILMSFIDEDDINDD